MRRTTGIAGALVAGVAAAVLLATPGLADTATQGRGSDSTNCDGTGQARQDGAQNGDRGKGHDGNGSDRAREQGRGNGQGQGDRDRSRSRSEDPAASIAQLSQGTLTDDQREELADMAEEEKLAHDVYVELGRSSGDTRFVRIADAESRHLQELRALMERYGVEDPTEGLAEGSFASAEVTAQYKELLERGRVSAQEALAVGAAVERQDIEDLDAASGGVTAEDVLTVYGNLRDGSTRHLAAFTR